MPNPHIIQAWREKQEKMRSLRGQLEIYEEARANHIRKISWIDKRIRNIKMELGGRA